MLLYNIVPHVIQPKDRSIIKHRLPAKVSYKVFIQKKTPKWIEEKAPPPLLPPPSQPPHPINNPSSLPPPLLPPSPPPPHPITDPSSSSPPPPLPPSSSTPINNTNTTMDFCDDFANIFSPSDSLNSSFQPVTFPSIFDVLSDVSFNGIGLGTSPPERFFMDVDDNENENQNDVVVAATAVTDNTPASHPLPSPPLSSSVPESSEAAPRNSVSISSSSGGPVINVNSGFITTTQLGGDETAGNKRQVACLDGGAIMTVGGGGDGIREAYDEDKNILSAINALRTGEMRLAFVTKSDVDKLDDGYRWHKYGQKNIKDRPHPRSYYRCIHIGCNVKKRVERWPEDASLVLTTYEGQHNHPLPPPRGTRGAGATGSVNGRGGFGYSLIGSGGGGNYSDLGGGGGRGGATYQSVNNSAGGGGASYGGLNGGHGGATYQSVNNNAGGGGGGDDFSFGIGFGFGLVGDGDSFGLHRIMQSPVNWQPPMQVNWQQQQLMQNINVQQASAPFLYNYEDPIIPPPLSVVSSPGNTNHMMNLSLISSEVPADRDVHGDFGFGPPPPSNPPSHDEDLLKRTGLLEDIVMLPMRMKMAGNGNN